METIVIDINSKEDKRIFTSLAKRLQLKARILTPDEKEDIGLAFAIDEGRKSGYVDEKIVMDTLGNLKHK
ncbi:MAG: hypothetical protein HY738_18795 [Bacteroidia bacterium]|nr:hypothetical protein [Bacteroidia bacterium]